MSSAELAYKRPYGLINPNDSQQELFAFPDMQGDGMSARGLVLREILKGISSISGDIVNKSDVVRCLGADRLGIATTVVRLPRMAACGWLVPTEHLIVVLSVAVAHFRVVLGAPDITLDPQVLLPKLVDQPSEGSKQAFFHRCPQRTQTLRVGRVLLEYGCQARIPLAQRLLLRIRNVTKVGFGHPRHGIRRRQCI